MKDDDVQKSNAGSNCKYSILSNEEGEIILVIEAHEEEPVNPIFIYDGGSTAILLRNMHNTVALRNIEVQAREPLTKAEEIHVVEHIGSDVMNDYIAFVHIVEDVESLIQK